MRRNNLLTATLLATLAMVMATGGVMLTGCSKSSDGAEVTAENIEGAEDVIAEANDTGSMVWRVTPEGQVKVLVKSPDGKPVEQDVSGTLTWQGPSGETKVPLTFDKDEKLLVAAAPKLEADLTEVKYEIKVGDRSWNGALHLPAGGTKAIVEGAKKASLKDIPKGKVGPNGGIIQVVGDDVVEVVADKDTGETRVYILDADLKPVAIGDRKVKLGFVGASSETVVLNPGPGNLYFVGKVSAKINPVKVTISITYVDHTDVVIVGYHPGKVIVVGAGAPVVKVLVTPVWKVDVKVKTPGVIVVGDDDDDDDDGFRVKFHGHGHGKGGAVIRF
jgi:hypothetical protein